MLIDLHIHTTASDGNIDPVTVVKMAGKAGLKIIAIADHESTSGYYPAYYEGRNHGITVIPAVELLSYYKDKEVHVLGYFNDPDNKYLQTELANLRNLRTVSSQKTVKKLNKLGFKITWNEVKKFAHGDSLISKGHIMQALKEYGYIKDRSDAVNIMTKYLNSQGLAYTRHDFSFEDSIELIKSSGGIPVLAHPGLIKDDEIVEELCDKGLMGIEVYYHYFGCNKEELIRKYESLAEKKNLIKTGGSDYHGTITPVILGENKVPVEGVRDFLDFFNLI